MGWTHEVASEVLGISVTYFKADYNQSNIAELQVLLKFNTDSAKVSKFAPVLFPPKHCDILKIDQAFLGPAPPLVSTCIYWVYSLLTSYWC
jgi:hypothetical protein